MGRAKNAFCIFGASFSREHNSQYTPITSNSLRREKSAYTGCQKLRGRRMKLSKLFFWVRMETPCLILSAHTVFEANQCPSVSSFLFLSVMAFRKCFSSLSLLSGLNKVSLSLFSLLSPLSLSPRTRNK